VPFFKLLTEETIMNKLILAIALTLLVAAGATTMPTVSQPAIAGCSGNNC
jgi:hypothetical protein